MPIFYNHLKANAISFLEKLRSDQSFLFKFSNFNQPNLIASGLAVMLGDLLGWLQNFDISQKMAWADYLNSFQRVDGFFEDKDISDCNLVSGYTRERALLHRSRHILFALTALGNKPRYKFSFIEDKLKPKSMENWMHSLDLSNFWDSGNKIMDLALFLTYEAKVNSSPKAAEAINLLLDICDRNTNPYTGYHDLGKSDLRSAMAGAMHIYPIYFLWGRKPKYPEKIIKTTLSLQQPDGFFSYETGTCGEDCLDYDAANILVNFSFVTDYYHEEILCVLKKLIEAMPECKNPDGGFCCNRRNESYRFGTITTEVPNGGSSLWSTYSRILTIAMAMKLLGDDQKFEIEIPGNNIMEIWDGGTGMMTGYLNFDNLKEY